MLRVESINDSTRAVLAFLVIGGLVAGYFIALTPSEVMAGLGGTAMGYWFGSDKKKTEPPPPAAPPTPPVEEPPKP